MASLAQANTNTNTHTHQTYTPHTHTHTNQTSSIPIRPNQHSSIPIPSNIYILHPKPVSFTCALSPYRAVNILYLSYTKQNPLMLCNAQFAVCCKTRTKHTNAM